MSNCPARAGFTHRPSSRPTVHRDHPRSRGVYPFRPAAVQFSVGSSPLARGLPNQTGLALVGSGIIPARAGFTQGRTVRTRTGTDHPRSRGVYTVCDAPYIVVCGSSPLARGLRTGIGTSCLSCGIIPARAGFTSAVARPTRPPSDHPRSRGVYLMSALLPVIQQGSSPLARGLLFIRALYVRDDGIVPARAGFTPWWMATHRHGADHPRSRGVYAWYYAVDENGVGSSPLARGLRGGPGGVGLRFGIIPARAGFTSCLARARAMSPDHPRSRGVYVRRWP